MTTVRIPSSHVDLAWGAGLFEGEGCFTYRTTDGQPSLCMNSTDHDVILTFERLFGGRVYGPYKRPPGKQQWRWQVNGHEGTQALGAAWWPWLHDRRRDRFKEVLRLHRSRYTAWLNRPGKGGGLRVGST